MFTQTDDWVSPIGGNWAYWAKNAKLIGEFVNANALHPATIGVVGAREEQAAAMPVRDLGIKGGIRVPHLHFNEHVYMLNEAQWAKFSSGIIANAKAKLADVKSVSFEEGMMLASIV